MRSTFHRLLVVLGTVLVMCAAAASVRAQDETERLERLRVEQQEILRKTQRLQTLMTRLLQRYEREGKQEQVDLLKAGLAHLEQTGVLREVASIRDDLGATALSEAVRKQTEVVEDLEHLLDILLERRSPESLNDAAKTAAARAASARELAQRERSLQQSTDEALRSDPNDAQQGLLEQLTGLIAGERAEAERNARDSGTRRPFLEAALERVERLLREEQRLAGALADERNAGQSTARQRQFDLGDLLQQARELARHVRGQRRQGELEAAAKELGAEAAGNDAEAAREARHRLDALIQDAPKVPGTSEGERTDPEWQQLGEALRTAPRGETPAERQALAELAARAGELAKQRAGESSARNAEDGGRLAARARELAEQFAAEANGEQTAPAQALDEAATAFDAAQQEAAKGDAEAARREVERAMSAVERARSQHQQQHPDAERQAGEMAAESAAAATELENAPRAQDAERAAAEQLRDAAEQLRGVESEVSQARQEEQTPTASTTSAAAREHLEGARQALSKALGEATTGREAELQAAAERQAELSAEAQRTAEAMRQAVENGELTGQQAEQASQNMQRARESMQQAEQSLRTGQQSRASQQQQRASRELEQAAEQAGQGQPTTDQQKEELARLAAEQEQIKEDIIRLAELLEEQENEAAKRKLDEAAAAAERAQQAMERGDADQSREQQEEAREKLEEAAQEFEQERDRYQDMRQEELLFKMQEELETFLERQRPITAATLEAQEAEKNGSLSRPTRMKLRRLGEEEHELAGRIEFLVEGLTEEGNQVYQTVLRSNAEDLAEVGDRLGSRMPDVGSFTTMLQQDVEQRSVELLAALERERQRRKQEREQKQQQQNQQSENKLNQQRERLVGLIAELEMLKTLLEDTGTATRDLGLLVGASTGEAISGTEAALVERLAHRHAELTKLFAQIKASVEAATQDPQQQEGEGK